MIDFDRSEKQGGLAGPSNASYGFAYGSAGTGTVIETITVGTRSTSITYTETSATSGVYQILPAAAFTGHDPTNTPRTYQFQNVGTANATVIETTTSASDSVQLTFLDGTQLIDQLVTITAPSTTKAVTYSFTGTNMVTRTVTEGSVSHAETKIDPLAIIEVTGTTATDLSVSGNRVVLTSFTEVGTSGTYVIASTDSSPIALGTATTPLGINPHDRLDFSFSGSSVSRLSEVSASGIVATNSVAPSTGHSFAIVTPGIGATSLASGTLAALGSGVFVEETVTHGTHTDSALFFSASGNSGVFTEVAHGATIDINGVANQLAQLATGHSALFALL